MQIKKGQIVTFKPEWSDPGDQNITFIALEDSSAPAAGGVARVLVQQQVDLPYKPTQIVSVDMIATAVTP